MDDKLRFVLALGLLVVIFFAYRGNQESIANYEMASSVEQRASLNLQEDEEAEEPNTKEREASETKQEMTAEEQTEKKIKKENTDPEESGKAIYLTFDDGPSAASKTILDTLEQYDAKGTFFMLEPAMRKFPDMAKRIVEEKHGAGLHGVTHEVKEFYSSEDAALKEMQTGQKTLKELTGLESSLIRTPYGSIPYFTQPFRDLFDKHDFKLWDWNIDSGDWNSTGDEYVKTVISQLEGLDPSWTPIVLMHDRKKTAEQLPKLMQYLKDNDYHTKVIEESTKPYHFHLKK